jgi:hypothetical protein
MSSDVISFAIRSTRFSTPSTAALTDAHTVEGGIRSTLDDVRISSNGGANYSIVLNDGVTDHYLARAVALGANSGVTLDLGQPVLLDGWTLKFQSSVGSALTFTYTLQDSNRMSAR